MLNIGFTEDMLTEFKSDEKKLSDEIMIEAVVAFANTDGGSFFLGVEDNGDITGIHPSHSDVTTLGAFIANKTVPPVSVRVELLDIEDKQVVKITVPKCRSIVSTSSGKVLRRRLKPDKTPENVPLYPFQIASRLSDLGMLDISAQPMPDATIDDFDPTERARLRNIIRVYNGEQTLLELPDDELDMALRLVTTVNGQPTPTYTGMLLIGRADRLAALIPTNELAIQVLKGTEVKVNEFFKCSLLAAFERINDYFNAWNSEQELEIGLFRVPVPEFDKRAFREGFINACCHRDYSMMGNVRVMIDDDGMTITNPGGFVEGITINNLLTAEARGRNQALADAFKRIGLAERTGRGIDRIFEGSLKYGRPLPDYSQTTSTTVNLFISRSMSDLGFVRMIAEEQNRIGRTLSINTLMVLNSVKRLHRASIRQISDDTNITEVKIKPIVEQLTEAGLFEAVGATKGREYVLSPHVYRAEGNAIGYVRQTGISQTRYRELIIQLVRTQGSVASADVAELLHLNSSQAYRQLKKLQDEGALVLQGKGRYARYTLSGDKTDDENNGQTSIE